MKFLAPILAIVAALPIAHASPRQVMILRDGWKFHRGPAPDAQRVDFDDSGWQDVSVPHDWAITGPFDKEVDKQTVRISQNQERKATEKTGRTGALPHIGEGWYRTRFRLPELGEDQRVLIQFEGAMSRPVVHVNGKAVGRWNYGYAYFHFDITEAIRSGNDNLLAVHLTNDGLSSRWYPGAGLYRKVQVIIKNRESFDHWGTFITTPRATPERATVKIQSRFTGEKLQLKTEILGPDGKQVAMADATQAEDQAFSQEISINNPQLWSPETPRLYQAVLRLVSGAEVRDEQTITFGIRTISYTGERGFELNGKPRKLKGVCLHHDLGPIGTAVNRAALRRQLVILKEMGCDAVRSAHNMPSIEQLELCDELGIMFLAESFDEWARPKIKNGYHRFFKTDAEKDVVNLVRATRNHPCIVMWSSGNEVPDQTSREGVALAKWLQDIFHREDPTRPVTVGMDQVESVMKSGFGAVTDVPGLNYRTHLYGEAHERFPQGILLGSETASTVSSRGVYHFPVRNGKMVQHDDLQCSSYDVECCSWSNLPEDDFVLQDDKPWVIGEFVWTGFDYLGEPTPYDDYWPSRSSYFGICDLAGLPKDRYYLYRSRWRTDDETLHVLPHWNWEGLEGEGTPVYVYTSHGSAELFLNGKSLGVRSKVKDKTPQHRYRLMWDDVPYQPGELRVVALDAGGKPVAEKSIRTAGVPRRIVLEADRSTLAADGEDLAFVTVSVVDGDGVPCPTASHRLNFEVTGSGTYRAACNGDASSLAVFHEATMKLFSGKLVVLVQSKKEPGAITLTVSGDGLKTGTIRLESRK
ncbi:MAG: DUF4982 domain-containing protein [Verrucomicrobia bacterium]|nr:DUF4982 domain-containing protein [Verrucomicrobiota bacterium]